MASLWIVHRDARIRAALARLADGVESLVAAPSDRRFDELPPPRLVILGVAEDFEVELEFTRRLQRRAGDAEWILLAEPRDLPEARRLFDALAAETWAYPPAPRELRQRVGDALARRPVEPLSERVVRAAVADRFARWFRDLALPELLPLLDPRLADVPVLVAGEPGTGRGLLARYVHLFGGRAAAPARFVDVRCGPDLAEEALRRALAAGGGRLTICLEDADVLAPLLQRSLRDWIELGPPAPVRGARVRWIATVADPGSAAPDRMLDPDLERALAGLAVRIPPLRERRAAIPALVEEAAEAWCRARGEPTRRFDPDALEALAAHPWPGNVRELESVVARSLAACADDPLRAEHVRLEPLGVGAAPAAEAGAPAEPELEGVLEALGPAAGVGAEIEAALEPEVAVFEPARAPEAAGEGAAPEPHTLRRLAGAVAHEVRNPLATIRALAQLLPERHGDPEFRERFARLVGADTGRIEAVVARLERFASLPTPRADRVDVSRLLERLLGERRPRIEQRRLLVLQELDRDDAFAWADPDQLEFAFEALLDRAVELAPERGDLYVASKRHASGPGGRPCVRVLLRLTRAAAGATGVQGLGLEETALDIPLAEQVIRAQGGRITVDVSQGDESLVLIDLPAPAGGS